MKKTKGNLIFLFIIGLLIGFVLGLRQSVPEKEPMKAETVPTLLQEEETEKRPSLQTDDEHPETVQEAVSERNHI